MQYRAVAILGDVLDALDSQYDEFGVSAPRDDYLAWAAAVKQYGGKVTAFPQHQPGKLPLVNASNASYADVSSGTISGDLYGAPAAAYSVNVIYPAPGYTLNPIFHREPDAWSNDSGTGYYLAPLSAMRYMTSGQSTQPQQAPGEAPPPNPDWYAQLQQLVKLVPWAIGGLLLVNVVGLLPRSRRD